MLEAKAFFLHLCSDGSIEVPWKAEASEDEAVGAASGCSLGYLRTAPHVGA